MTFEEKKQNIVDFIVDELTNFETRADLGIMVVKFNNMMTDLQPDVKTCASCEHVEKFQYKHKEKGRCKAMTQTFLGFEMSKPIVLDINNFGCIHHKER